MRQPFVISAVMVFCLFFPLSGLAQVINATLTGTVSDPSGALIPGVEITARQINTGVVSTVVTNESGTYRFGSLQPGSYQVTAELPGFRAQAFQLTLGTSQQIRQNFTLQVGAVTQQVEVSVAPDQLLTAEAASVGNVLPQRQISDLPLVGRNVMDLTAILPGVQGGGSAGSGRRDTTFAGIPAGGSGNIGLQMDGVTMNTGRYLTGLATNNAINPDMVEEVRVVVAAVDPEGRGSAQVQIRTRSGTNQFHGGFTWNARNSALDANSWSNNRQHIVPTWYNRHQYTASVGGPVIRNKTFFFGMFDGQNGLQKETVDGIVLTDAARQGIFRFFPGINNGNAETTVSGSGTTRVAPVVDLAGNPLDWTQVSGAAGPLRSFNVFGDATNPGDPFRARMDPTGFIGKVIQNMPRPNAFNVGDGLNTASHRWVRRVIVGGGIGQGADADAYRRKQFFIKIDHHFNPSHRLTGSFAREYRYSNNEALSPWPNGWNGENTQDPAVIGTQLTSTLTPTLLNEFRWAYRLTKFQSTPSYLVHKEAWDFLTKINGIPILQNPPIFPVNMVGRNDYGHRDPLSTYTNTLTWTKGVHAIKTGVEFRFAGAASWVPSGGNTSGNILPIVIGGAGDVPVRGIDQVPGMLPPNITLAQNLLLALSGSVDSIQQKFETREPDDIAFRDFRTTFFNPDDPNDVRRSAIHDWHQNEINFFIKDDWKISPRLTLNLGLRYDLMRVPYMLSGSGKRWTPGLLGGSAAVFGYSGRDIGSWMSGGGPQKGELTQGVLIGKGTKYPEQGIWPSDKNNFGPAIGFAWSPSLWGQDRTTIRGGYQIAYQLPGNSLSWVDSDVGKLTPGFVFDPVDRGNGTFRDFSNIVIPVPVSEVPFQVVPITQRSQNISVFAPGYTTPYVQTFTLGVTRSLTSALTLDVRYIGTRGVKIHSGLNLNDVDIRNNGVLQALEITRAGGDAPMFDQMLKGLNIGSGVVGVAVSGSEALRRHASFRTLIANGDFVAVARLLNTTNIGTVQPAGQIIAGGTLRSSGLFPENFFVVNPQFNTVTYRNNTDNSKYHSLQSQVTLRSRRGLNYQATYTWSRSMGLSGGPDGLGFQDIRNQSADYAVLPAHRTHDFRNYGTLELPFGPGKLIGGNTSGWLAQLIGAWQVGTIFAAKSGAPLSIGGVRTLYAATGTVDIVGAFPRNSEAVWPLKPGDTFGNFFDQQYQRTPDPACANVASNLRTWCTITALADANGNIVLRNSEPGRRGTLGIRTINGPGQWTLDADVQKRIRITESKNLTFRLDAQNVFNHPLMGNPNMDINSGTFGQITTKTGNRTLAAQIRFEF
jgi:hypothetical protein